MPTSILSLLCRLTPALGFAALLQLPATPACAQAPPWTWARNQVMTAPTGGGSSLITPKRVAVDGSGNSYVFGSYSGILTLGAFAFTNNTGADLYVAKYDAAGTCLWGRVVGGPGVEAPQDLAVDAAGNVFVTGYFEDNVTFGSTTLTAGAAITQRGALFVGKLNTAGTWQWATKFGVDTRQPRTTTVALALAPDGDVLLGGTFNDAATRGAFPFAFGSIVLSTTASTSDVFAARLDPTGATWRWAIQAGTPDFDGATAVATDAAGNAYLTGFFNGTVAFGAQSVTATGTAADVFVAKLNPAGQWVWANSGGGSSPDAGSAIATDAAGNCAIAGRIIGSFGGTVTFGSTTLVLNPGRVSSGPDVLVAKLSSTGQWQWATRAGGPGGDSGESVALDAQGNVYAAGRVNIAADFGSTTVNNTPVSNPTIQGDQFLGRLSPTGAWQWVTLVGQTLTSFSNVALAFDGSNTFVTGSYTNQAVFGATTFSPAPNAANAGYLAKLGSAPLATRTGAQARALTLWPQPAAAGAALQLQTTQPGTFTLLDALGRQAFTAVLPAGELRLLLPGNLPPGIYQSRLATADGLFSQKLLVE